MMSGAPEYIDSLSVAPEKMDSSGLMSATSINNTLYGCKKWRLAKANAHRIEPDTPEDNSQH